ncbi:MAG: TIGR01777 family protein [Micrococcales bacterium]|nr:MAG: TIGR01777 family protein [Micrococcales bacterium]
MRIVVSGASGLIGSALLPALRAAGHEVLQLVRRDPAGPDEVRWDPGRGELDPRDLAGVQAAINLSGAGVADKRWTEEYKQIIRSSRVDATLTLVGALTRLDEPAATLLQGSAIGFYGNANGDRILTERSPGGSDFLAGVVQEWESAAAEAERAGMRVAYLRTGLVMAPHGGAFARVLPLFKLGLGGRLGSGRMWWSWITLPDHVAATRFLLDSDIAGPVNLVSPDPVTNADFTSALGKAVNRPAVLPVPKPALNVALGEFSNDVLASHRVVPTLLQDAGFHYRHRCIEDGAGYLVS